MPFDPNSPFTVVEEQSAATGFDPSQPFSVVEEPTQTREINVNETPPPDLDPDEAAVLVARRNAQRLAKQGPAKEVSEPFVKLPEWRPEFAPWPFKVARMLGIPGAETAGKSAEAVYGKVKKLVEGIESPSGAMLTGATLIAPGVTVPLLGAAAIPGMIRSGAETIQKLGEGDVPAATGAATETAINAAMVLGGSMAATRLLPRSSAELATTPKAEATLPTPSPPAFDEAITETFASPVQNYDLALGPWPLKPPSRQLVGAGIPLPETMPLPEAPPVAPISRQLTGAAIPLPETTPPETGPVLTHGAEPGEVISRISLPAEPETAKLARQVWAKPVDPETQAEGADALRQLSSMTEEKKTPGEPYQPPTVNVDLRQLERMMQRNTVSKVESWADKVIQDKLRGTGANPFLDPEFMAAAAAKGAILYKRGVTKLADWSDAMRKQFGVGLDEVLPKIYQQSKDYWESRKPGAEAAPTTPEVNAVQERKTAPVPVEESSGDSAKVGTQVREQATPQAQEEALKQSAEPSQINTQTGGAKAPPPGSVFTPNTPPSSDPWPIYGKRVRDWWEWFWPRSWAAMRQRGDTPVITEHQRLLFTPVQFMQEFSKQPWWKEFNKLDDVTKIEAEDAVVRDYRARRAVGEDHLTAWNDAVAKAPPEMREYFRYREQQRPLELAASEELGIDPPESTADPYIPRLTNEEGKLIVDLHPKNPNALAQVRSTLGSYSKSREHPTMKEGIANGTQYDPMSKAVWLRELTGQNLIASARMLKALREQGVLFDSPEAARAAGGSKAEVGQLRGFGGRDYWTSNRQELRFLEQNLVRMRPSSSWSKMNQFINGYLRNPNLINPLPHTTKNMFFKYALARVGNFTFRKDVAEFASATPTELKARFDKVMPFNETGERMPEMTAREIGGWADKVTTAVSKLNKASQWFIFAKADPAMRFALWKSYVRKGMSDQEAANHVWLDLVRYDENSGGMSFWKEWPGNFFVPWRVGTYVTLFKAMRAHPFRTLAFVGAIEYLREIRYRKTGRWTHLPVDYLDAPLAESIEHPSRAPAIAATTLLFGPGGGQAPATIKDAMSALTNDPGNRSRVINMFWGISQLYNLPREFNAFLKDKNPDRLVNLLMDAALAEHSALKYEPRRLMKWLPEWLPGLQKSELVQYAETLQKRAQRKQEKRQTTYERRHGVSATFERSPEEQQLEELKRLAR